MPELRQRPPMSARTLSDQLPERLIEAKAEGERQLREPFSGIVAAVGRREGLFPLRRTGVGTERLVSAARHLLESLSLPEREEACFPIDSDAWRRWSNIHPFFMRHGLSLEGLVAQKRERALALVAAALSEEGYEAARDVMRLNENLREISGSDEEYGEWLYWLSLFGEPSATEPWGFQLDGHHLIVNCFVLGDQLVVTPMFLGSEPVLAASGKYKGTRVFAAEEHKALRLGQSLSAEQFAVAQLATATPGEIFTAAYRDNLVLDPQGIAYGELDDEQRERLVELVAVHVGRIRAGHSELRMAEVGEHLDETRFAWMGGRGDDDPFYYRVHSPVLLIEFDHLAGIAFDNDEPTRNHVHSVVRTPNGNDYGADLLAQHHALAHANGARRGRLSP
ncbi:MAG TPA: DUF3500 domain-containing protein [Acidimicrobiales bacterium]|nr:DUF3500 domain-containing protein [Acidimicrobiales bacterium]